MKAASRQSIQRRRLARRAPHPTGTAATDKPGQGRKLSKEAEETLEAIRAGQIDALVVRRNDFDELYALRAFAEIERTEAALKKAGIQRKQTLAQLRALMNERERLFQDMHDGCIQSIYAVGLNLEASLRLFEASPKDARQIIADATASLNLVIQELRSFINGRKQEIGSGRDLRTEIQKAVQTAKNRGVTFAVDIDEFAMRDLSSEQALHLLQIAREGISNTMRHSNARTGRIALTKRDGKVRFEISDDGKGFAADKLNGLGLGLHHIDARARKMGGRAHVSSVPNQGTRIVVDLGQGTLIKAR